MDLLTSRKQKIIPFQEICAEIEQFGLDKLITALLPLHTHLLACA